MKRMILSLAFLISSFSLFAQTQTHNIPFNIDGIRGVAVVLTKPATMSFGAVVMDVQSITINNADGVSDIKGRSFPMECGDCRIYGTADACMNFTGPPYDCESFSFKEMGKVSDYVIVDWPQSIKDRHNQVRRETGVGVWQERGLVRNLQISSISGSMWRDILSKMGKSSSSDADNGSNNDVASNDPLDQITRDVMRPSTFPRNPRLERERNIQEQHQKHVESTRRSSTANQSQTSGKRQSTGPSEEELERRRKADEWERQRRKLEEDNRKRQEYAQWRDQQNSKNAQLAAATAVGTVSMLAVFGKLIYSGMGQINPDQVYRNKIHGYFGAEFGYSFFVQPVYFNSTVYDGVDYKSNTDYDFNWPVNFDMNFKLGFESDYVGAYAHGGLGLGMSVLAHSFNFPTVTYGGQIHAGLKNAKFLFGYGAGERTMSTYYWMFVEESGEGISDMNWSNIRYGARFSWGDFVRTHLSAGLIYERVGAAGDSQVQRIVLENAPDREDGRFIPGYFLEFKKDHSYNFFLSVYPNYPFTGQVEHSLRNGDGYEDGSIYFTVGFHRSLDIFF